MLQNTDLLGGKLDRLFEKAKEAYSKLIITIHHAKPEELFVNQETFLKRALDFSIIELDKNPIFKSEKIVEFYTQPQPSFNKQFDLLMKNLNDNFHNGIKNYLFSSNK